MQRTAIILSCFFICTNNFAQQYPFVHYTPKDGLISNSIRGIYQDSRGRMYFISINGLSVYDGARFINYTSKNGLGSDIVNCVMEMGDDSVWVATNDGRIQCLVNGKLKPVTLKEPSPIIDNLIRDEEGTLYAASEQGLFIFEQNKFIKIPFTDINGKNVNTYIGSIYLAGKHLLVVRDNSMLNPEERHILYLYDKKSKRIITQTQKEKIFFVAKAPDGRIWASTNKNIQAIDTTELKKGKIAFQKLPYNFIIESNTVAFINFDKEGNCWLSDKVFTLKKLSRDGKIISFVRTSGLSSMDISHVFQDKEGTIWIATFNAGIDKLLNSNFSISADVLGISAINSISYAADIDEMLLYSPNNAKAISFRGNDHNRVFEVNDADKFSTLFTTPKGLLGIAEKNIYKVVASGNRLYPKIIFTDTVDNVAGHSIVDKNGNFILCGKYYITAVLDGKTIYRKKINYYADHAALDTSGDIWIATRAGELSRYRPRASDPSNYLEDEIIISKRLSDISPRSIIIDKNNNIWIGTRSDGIFAYQWKNENLTQLYHLNIAMGLSDNFIAELAYDDDNNIWACSASGLDKISVRNGIPVIENLTKQNNIYQKVFNVVIDKNNITWALLHNSIIKIGPESRKPSGYSPALMVSMIKSGRDTITGITGSSLSHKQNNLSFYFAATSFLDEKQVLYSYRLQRGSNNQWSEPSNNTTVSFIDLPSGDYTLDIKANFPAARYPDKIISYKFSIVPPWWQTGLFRSAALFVVIWILILGVRFYYRRKLEKQMTVLEKKQAIEKERTRIATDMHDDLGAGLSRIKFLSETIGIKQQQQKPFEEDISKIREYSHEMIDKMGEIVWALNEKNDSLSDLLSYTRSYAVEYLSQNGIKCRIDTPDKLPAGFVSGEFRRNIYLTVKEALHNVVKHSQASEVIMKFDVNHNLNIEIKDDGTGFHKSAVRPFSNGLSNMQSRIKEIGGVFELINGNGTLIRIKVPLNG